MIVLAMKKLFRIHYSDRRMVPTELVWWAFANLTNCACHSLPRTYNEYEYYRINSIYKTHLK